MKKIIVIVSSVIILLGVNFASGREIASVTDIFQPVWDAISSLTTRVAVLEQKPVSKSLKVVDANSNDVGLLVSYEGQLANIWEATSGNIIMVDLSTGEFKPDQHNGVTYYFSSDCSGDHYIAQSGYAPGKIYVMDSSLSNGINFFAVAERLENVTTHSQWATGLQSCIQRDENHSVYKIVTIQVPENPTPPLAIVLQ